MNHGTLSCYRWSNFGSWGNLKLFINTYFSLLRLSSFLPKTKANNSVEHDKSWRLLLKRILDERLVGLCISTLSSSPSLARQSKVTRKGPWSSFDFSDFVIIAELQALITNFYRFSLPEVNLFTSSSGKKTNLYLDRFSPISGTFLSGYLGLKKCRLHTLSVMLVCH